MTIQSLFSTTKHNISLIKLLANAPLKINLPKICIYFLHNLRLYFYKVHISTTLFFLSETRFEKKNLDMTITKYIRCSNYFCFRETIDILSKIKKNLDKKCKEVKDL